MGMHDGLPYSANDLPEVGQEVLVGPNDDRTVFLAYVGGVYPFIVVDRSDFSDDTYPDGDYATEAFMQCGPLIEGPLIVGDIVKVWSPKGDSSLARYIAYLPGAPRPHLVAPAASANLYPTSITTVAQYASCSLIERAAP